MLLGGRAITRLAVHRRPELGLARTFQSVRLFGRLSVAENLEAAVLATGVGGRRARERVDVLLGRMDLLEHRDDPAAQLSHGTERRVGIARALATAPAFLLLDEPAAGLDDVETRELGVLLTADPRRPRDRNACRRTRHVARDDALRAAACAGRRAHARDRHPTRDARRPGRAGAYLGLEEERLVVSG